MMCARIITAAGGQKILRDMSARLIQVWTSFRHLPSWVQLWLGIILVPANAASLLLLDTPSGTWAAWAGLFVIATNIPIMLRDRGMSRLMALPHLLAWVPLHLALVVRLNGGVASIPLSAAEQAFAIMILIINGVSLTFDVTDTWRWCRGERSVP